MTTCFETGEITGGATSVSVCGWSVSVTAADIYVMMFPCGDLLYQDSLVLSGVVGAVLALAGVPWVLQLWSGPCCCPVCCGHVLWLSCSWYKRFLIYSFLTIVSSVCV